MIYIKDKIEVLLNSENYPLVDKTTREFLIKNVAQEAIGVISAEQSGITSASPLYGYYSDAKERLHKDFNVTTLTKNNPSNMASDNFVQEIQEIQAFIQQAARLVVDELSRQAQYHQMTMSMNASYGFAACSRAAGLVRAHFAVNGLDENHGQKQNKPKM
jgi:hypothetical protein